MRTLSPLTDLECVLSCSQTPTHSGLEASVNHEWLVAQNRPPLKPQTLNVAPHCGSATQFSVVVGIVPEAEHSELATTWLVLTSMHSTVRVLNTDAPADRHVAEHTLQALGE